MVADRNPGSKAAISSMATAPAPQPSTAPINSPMRTSRLNTMLLVSSPWQSSLLSPPLPRSPVRLFLRMLTPPSSGANTNGCQFFITSKAAPFLDGQYVAFGKVIEGMDVVRKVENVRVILDRPTTDVVITQCGEM